MKSLRITIFLLLYLAAGLSASANESGKLAYEMNCKACHQLDTKLVGPSLVAVAATYPPDKQAEFISWAQAPGKKDPKLLQMPPMAHVPEPTLVAIHAYVLDVTKGVKEKRGNHHFPNFKEPNRKLPYVVRSFLPDASPASVAVILKNNISLCWDTEACRFRYAWQGNKTRLTKWQTVAELPSAPYYRETTPQLWSIADAGQPEFSGYRLKKDGSPVFEYRFGDVEVQEHIHNGTEKGSFVRSFWVSGVPDDLQLNPGTADGVKITADKGEMKNGVLTLNKTEAKQFTLTVTKL
ncbi:MAG: c-type cytochrome [Verrucomicrobiales bacterium]|nr:c-type cytochrome [Verrucomicrobiales bacterium]